MSDYLVINDSEIAIDAPGTTSLFHRLRDNPLAITEGANGAPRIMPRAILNPPFPPITITNTSPNGFTGLDPEGVLFFMASGTTMQGISLQMRTSSDGGASWGGWHNISGFGGNYSGSQATSYMCVGTLSLATGDFKSNGSRSFNATYDQSGISSWVQALGFGLSGVTGQTAINAVQFRMSTAPASATVTAYYIGRTAP